MGQSTQSQEMKDKMKAMERTLQKLKDDKDSAEKREKKADALRAKAEKEKNDAENKAKEIEIAAAEKNRKSKEIKEFIMQSIKFKKMRRIMKAKFKPPEPNKDDTTWKMISEFANQNIATMEKKEDFAMWEKLQKCHHFTAPNKDVHKGNINVETI